MPRLVSFRLYELDLPFRRPFRHAASARHVSESLFLVGRTEDNDTGYGETLPRSYVTGETRHETFDLLKTRVLPHLIGLHFDSFAAVYRFLVRCDGKAPPAWVDGQTPQTAAWCAVDLVLLDTFARAFGVRLGEGLSGELEAAAANAWPPDVRYGLVLSDEPGWNRLLTLIKARLYGLREAKVKMSGYAPAGVRLARALLGRSACLRVDSNMAWSRDEALKIIDALRPSGVASFEQPLPATDLAGMAALRTKGAYIVADESFHDAASLEQLISAQACSGVNVRISKCGGLVASLARCRRAREAGLALHIGCQVGETSQLSAAQLALIRTLGPKISHVEGCFGERLLVEDPVKPVLEFRRAGRPPVGDAGFGFGTCVDLTLVERHAKRQVEIGATEAIAAEALP